MKKIIVLLLLMFSIHLIIVFFYPISIVNIFDYFNVQTKALNNNNISYSIDNNRYCLLLPNKCKLNLKGKFVPLFKGTNYRINLLAKSEYKNTNSYISIIINGEYICEFPITNSFWHKYQFDFKSKKNNYTYNSNMEVLSYCSNTNLNKLSSLSLSCSPVFNFFNNDLNLK